MALGLLKSILAAMVPDDDKLHAKPSPHQAKSQPAIGQRLGSAALVDTYKGEQGAAGQSQGACIIEMMLGQRVVAQCPICSLCHPYKAFWSKFYDSRLQ